jgi:hypothetical protein
MRNLLAGLICASLLLVGCGGGGSTAATSSSGGSGSGSSGSGSSGSGSTPGHNVANAIVDQGPAALNNAGYAAINVMYVNVTICAPGSTTNCQTIDHVQVDTGSQGVRIIASVLNSSLLSALQPVSVTCGSLAECTQFVDGYSWGPIVSADVHVGGSDTATTGESAPDLPIQLIGTTTYAVPTDCSSTGGEAENTVVQFGGNGIIGVGLFEEDCGTGCSAQTANGFYYSCPSSSGCSQTTVPVTSQTQNPVYGLAANGGVTDNNGVIIELPAVGADGAETLAGSLVFGIGTQSNNALSAGATILTTNSYTGYVTTAFNSESYTTSYVDSGSNALYFDDSNIVACTSAEDTGFFCPASSENFTATMTGANAVSAVVLFSIANADTLFNTYPSSAAFSNLGGSASALNATGASGGSGAGTGTFAWGLPFFYGQNVYFAMENTEAGGAAGPYVAF